MRFFLKMPDLILSANDFKTLSSETRVRILKLLASRNYNLTELSVKLSLSAPSIKQHIDLLVESRLIEQVDSSHKWKYYTLSRKGRKLVDQQKANSQVLIVLATVFIGLVGVAAIASMLLGGSPYSMQANGLDNKVPATISVPAKTSPASISAGIGEAVSSSNKDSNADANSFTPQT
jgi:DNA-binding transcriptional ArsR family regulator